MEIYAGTSEVARWCGVSNPAVSNWLLRYTTYPGPDVQLGIDRGLGAERYGWRPERRPEWLAWQASDRTKRIDPDSIVWECPQCRCLFTSSGFDHFPCSETEAP